MKQLKITCTYNETLKLDELSDFQGHLKIRNDEDYKKIIKSIEKYGFSFPFFVWKNNDKNLVLDGHGRLRALQIMRENGTEIDDIPVVYVSVKNEKEAKDLLLRLNSQYGRMTKQSVAEFIGKDFDLNLDDFQLPAFNLDFSTPAEPIDDYYNQQIARRDYVSPTTHAPDNPVVNEMPLEGGIELSPDAYINQKYEVADNDDFSEPILPTSFERESLDKKDFVVKITFGNTKQVDDFLKKYQSCLKAEFGCLMSVSGGML